MTSSTTDALDLSPYLAGGGLPPLHLKQVKLQIDTTVVAGVDREHNQQMITHCDATSDYLYGDYTPQPTYKQGSRPMLERIVTSITSRFKTEPQQIQAMVTWVIHNTPHAGTINCKTPSDTAPTEERMIEQGWAWCNEQGRLLVSLAQIAGYRARMCFLFHKNAPQSHATTEIFFNDKWVFVDPTYGLFICGDPAHPYSARDLQRDPQAKRICDDQHARAFVIKDILSSPERIPGPSPKPLLAANAHMSDYFCDFALCNYLI